MEKNTDWQMNEINLHPKDCKIEKLQYLLAEEAALKEDWEEWESWQTATDVRIIQTALKRCIEYIEKDIKATYYI